MLYDILPEWLFAIINKNFLIDYIYEIRIRINKPVMVNYKGVFKSLFDNDNFQHNAIIANQELISYILSVSTKQSIYAYNDQIKECYITTDSGIRIGLCGTVVYNNGRVNTIKKITSINIRVSHEVIGCSEKIIKFLVVNNTVKNTLIISPPGSGKTTMIRDICCKLSNEKNIQNILVVDERFEIAGINSGYLNIGNYVDVISGSEKQFAFKNSLKTMNPSVIVTDEISKEEDIQSIMQAIKSGVKVIATAHALNISDLKEKMYFDFMINNKYFERIVVLSSRNGIGTVEGIYDENLRGIYIPYIIWRFFYYQLLYCVLD